MVCLVNLSVVIVKMSLEKRVFRHCLRRSGGIKNAPARILLEEAPPLDKRLLSLLLLLSLAFSERFLAKSRETIPPYQHAQ